MKVWITKYALTQGIFEAEAVLCSDISREMIAVHPKSGSGTTFPSYYHRDDWHRDHNDALIQAECMRLKKIGSLQKQLHKFKAMRFV